MIFLQGGGACSPTGCEAVEIAMAEGSAEPSRGGIRDGTSFVWGECL